MTITVSEKLPSREVTDTGKGTGSSALLSFRLSYIVQGSNDESLVIQAVRSTAPTTYSGLDRGTIRAQMMGPEAWEVTVEYNSPASQLEEGDTENNFDIGYEMVHITQALSVVSSHVADPGDTAPDFQGAINVHQEGDRLVVDGLDVPSPISSWSRARIVSDDDMTPEYFQRLSDLVGKVNNSTFEGFSAGEVRFEGVSGRHRQDGTWELTERFKRRANVTGLTVGDIAGISKKGWEYMSVLYREEEDATAHALVMRPRAVYILQIFEEDNFDKLDPSYSGA